MRSSFRAAQAQEHLDAGQLATAAAAALRAAAAAGEGHTPLLSQVPLLAERAWIPLRSPAAGVIRTPPPAETRAPHGLTGRELAVLLLAAGRTNAQIGAELYISRKPLACTSAASCASSGLQPGASRCGGRTSRPAAPRVILNTPPHESKDPRPPILGDHPIRAAGSRSHPRDEATLRQRGGRDDAIHHCPRPGPGPARRTAPPSPARCAGQERPLGSPRATGTAPALRAMAAGRGYPLGSPSWASARSL